MTKEKLISAFMSVLGITNILTGSIVSYETNYNQSTTNELYRLMNTAEANTKDLNKIEKRIQRISNVRDKEQLEKEIANYKEYLEVKETINKYYQNNELIVYVNTETIEELKIKVNSLEKDYKDALADSLKGMESEQKRITQILEKIDKLYLETTQSSILDITSLDTLNTYKEELYTIKIPTIGNEYQAKVLQLLDKYKRQETEKQQATENAWVKLNVPYISQNLNNVLNGCEAADVLMALKYKGYLNEMDYNDFVKLMPLSPDNDAEKGFTHDMYGLDPLTIPHWIAPEPLKNFAINVSGNNNIINGTGMSIDELDRELDNGNPVVIYVTAFFAEPKEVVENINVNLHVMLLTGYNKITGDHYVVDPWTHSNGRTSWTVSRQTIEARYNALGKKCVIIR